MVPRRPSGQSHIIWPVVEILVPLDVVAFGQHCGPLFGENYSCKGICDWLSCRKKAICVICALSQIDVEVVCLLICIFICFALEHSESLFLPVGLVWCLYFLYLFVLFVASWNICGCFNSGGDFPAEFLPFLFVAYCTYPAVCCTCSLCYGLLVFTNWAWTCLNCGLEVIVLWYSVKKRSTLKFLKFASGSARPKERQRKKEPQDEAWARLWVERHTPFPRKHHPCGWLECDVSVNAVKYRQACRQTGR